MNTSQTIKKIPVSRIVVISNGQAPWATTWAGADEMITSYASKVPVLKLSYTVHWADGFKAEGTYSLPKGQPSDLAASIKNVWLYYAGLWRPEKIPEEHYDGIITKNLKRRDEATIALRTYALEDMPADTPVVQSAPVIGELKSFIPKPSPITSDDLKLTQDFIASLVQRAEAPVNGAPVDRALALELRKALAAIIRACTIKGAQ